MADGATAAMLRISAAQLAKMNGITRSRERERIIEIIEGYRAVEDSLGNTDTVQMLQEIIEAITPAPVAPVAPVRSDTPDMAKLIVKGLEDEPFPGYDAVEDGSLPPVRERDDEDDAVALARRFG